MVVISYSGKEANAKIVYYGPGLGGKTTNLEFIYDSVPASSRGKMVSMKTQTDRTLFFDFLPLDLGELGGFKTRFLLYTVPGQVFYNATRKLVLRGVDAVAFIADSEIGKMDENKESLANLEENLAEYDLKLDSIPWVIQYNKRDLPQVYMLEELNKELNPRNVPYFEAVATEGTGVFETFRGLSRLLLEKLSEEIGHRMVISRSFGRKQEQESETGRREATPILQAEPAHEPEKVREETPEPARIESSTTQPETIELSPRAAHETSDVDTEELEIISEKTETVSPKDELIQESQAQAEPTIAHERDAVPGFFDGTGRSTELDKEIVREEVILSKEPDLAPPSQTPTVEEVTEDQPAAYSDEPVGEPITAGEETQWRAQEPVREQVVERQVQSAEEAKPAGDESFFRRMVRRNNVGIFGAHHRDETDDTESGEHTEHVEQTEHVEHPEHAQQLEQTQLSYSQEQSAAEVASLEQVIEIPAAMLKEGKEIVITLRLRAKADAESTETPADEFMLDGISR